MNTNISETQDEILQKACEVARIADDLRAQDVKVLDLRGITSVCDFFVIATGASTRQMRAVVEEVNKSFKSEQWPFRQLEGSQNDQWILADFGDLILHMFQPEAREMYDLEGLWGGRSNRGLARCAGNRKESRPVSRSTSNVVSRLMLEEFPR